MKPRADTVPATNRVSFGEYRSADGDRYRMTYAEPHHELIVYLRPNCSPRYCGIPDPCRRDFNNRAALRCQVKEAARWRAWRMLRRR